jgi:outer membrane protein TolC
MTLSELRAFSDNIKKITGRDDTRLARFIQRKIDQAAGQREDAPVRFSPLDDFRLSCLAFANLRSIWRYAKKSLEELTASAQAANEAVERALAETREARATGGQNRMPRTPIVSSSNELPPPGYRLN